MRMEVYYEDFLRRDVLDKLGRFVGEVNGIKLSLSCKGLEKVEEIGVVKSLLLLESITGCKVRREVGISASKFLDSGKFVNFLCSVVLKRRIDMFYFLDRWISIYGVEFLSEGGITEVKEDDGILIVYHNLNDYVEMMPRFNRFKSIIRVRFELSNNEGMFLIMKGLGIL